MNTITQILNWISSALLLPDIVLLLAALASSLISLGGFAAAALERLGEQVRRKRLLEILCAGKDSPAKPDEGAFATAAALMASSRWERLECEKILSDLKGEHDRELERSRFLAKVGPMLGLMGTLIPMGPALAGLASGDIASMAYNMQIAFATTVVGCFIAGAGVLVHSVKKHWFADEIADLAYLLEKKCK